MRALFRKAEIYPNLFYQRLKLVFLHEGKNIENLAITFFHAVGRAQGVSVMEMGLRKYR